MKREMMPTSCPLCGDAFPPGALLCPNDKTPRPEPPVEVDLSDDDDGMEEAREPTHVNIRIPIIPNSEDPSEPKRFQVGPGTIIGEYVVEEKLGEGGMGEIWRGSQPLIGKQVAIKILRRKMAEDQEAIARFIQEAKVVNSIKHKGLIDIFSFGDLPDERPYFVMEYLEGKSLASYLAENGPLPWSEISEIMTQVCGALGATHQRGIIHRDLKSENLFLVMEDNKPTTAKLLDFGIAKLVSPDQENAQLTQAGDIFGTPAYMSPEHCQGTVTNLSDIYSLGIILFEMITGRTPFYEPGEKVANVLVRQMSELAPPPSALVSGREVPSEVDSLVLRTLSKRPEERPASCEELAKEIQEVIAPLGAQKEAKSAKPVFAPTIQRRMVAQPKKSSAPIFAFAALLAVGALGGGYYIATQTTPPPATQMAPATLPPTSIQVVKEFIPSTTPIHPEKIHVSIKSSPSRALVLQGEKELGETPFEQDFPYGEEALVLTLQKEGYEPEDLSITPNQNFQAEKLLSRTKDGKKSPKDKPDKNPKDEPKEEPKNPKDERPLGKDEIPKNPFGTKKP